MHLNEIVTALVQDRRALAARSGLLLEVVCDPQLPATRGDPRLLAQVFTNLLTNAMNYTPSGGQVTLRTPPRAQRAWSVVEFADSGPGIPIDEQALLFRRFFAATPGRHAASPVPAWVWPSARRSSNTTWGGSRSAKASRQGNLLLGLAAGKPTASGTSHRPPAGHSH